MKNSNSYNLFSISRSFFQLVGDLDELKRKDYADISRLKIQMTERKVPKGKSFE